MFRRKTQCVLQTIWIPAVAMSVSLYRAPSVLGAEPSTRPEQPNIVFLMCDQLAAGAISGYGGPVPTPHIDRLAREGVRFNQATCTTPFCSPSRASIITGLYPHAHGIVANCAPVQTVSSQRGITANDVTTEGLLSKAGYATHHYGKWHLLGERLAYYPDMFNPEHEYPQEMAEVFAKVRATAPADWMEWYQWALPVEVAPPLREAVRRLGDRWRNERLAEFVVDMGRLKLPLEQVYDVRIADLTVERIRGLTRQTKPFMATCSFNGPHDPNVVPSPYYEQFDPAKIALPANHDVREARFEKDWGRRIVTDLGEPGLREFLRIYYGSIKLIDDQVGRILRAIEEAGIVDDTIIIFTADHGDMAGGHGMVWKSTSAFYDEIVRVPLIIRYPHRFKPQTCELAVDFTDLMPTLLELAGRPIPEQVQGRSLVPWLTGRHDAAEARPFSFCERVRPNPDGSRKVSPDSKGASFMIRGQGWKYIRYSKAEEYLYHLADDPGETRNLIDDKRYAEPRRRLSAELDAWLRRTGRPH